MDGRPETGVLGEGVALVKAWIHAHARVEELEREHHQAKMEAQEAEEALAKWMKPPDVKPFEKIGIWFGDSLLQLEVGGVHPGEGPGPREAQRDQITVRYRGAKFGELAL